MLFFFLSGAQLNNLCKISLPGTGIWDDLSDYSRTVRKSA
jgi:hypothetical protein